MATGLDWTGEGCGAMFEAVEGCVEAFCCCGLLLEWSARTGISGAFCGRSAGLP
jgi:hypothetical protein